MTFLPRTLIDRFFFGLCIMLLLCAIILSYTSPAKQVSEEIQETPVVSNPFEKIPLTARAAYVFDIKNQKVLFEKNADQELPLASLTKIMTTVVALEHAPRTSELTFSKDAIQQEGDSGLIVGEKWKLEDLINFTLVSSSNDGAYAIASSIEAISPQGKTFVSLMNEKAASLGLVGMSFTNPTGLDTDTLTAGAYGSARDVARLYEYALSSYPEIFKNTAKARTSISSEQLTHTAVNTNTNVNAIQGLIGSKTGYSDLAGGNLGVIIDLDIGHPIVIVVLGSTAEDRFTDVLMLASSTRATYN